MKQTLVLTGIFGLALCLAACGYRFAGTGRLPGGVSAVHVAMFENRTLERGAEHVFTRAMIGELVRKAGVSLAGEEDAGAVLRGTVVAITLDTLTRSADDSTVERQVRALLDLTLTDRSGEVLWSARGFSGDEEYTVSEQNQTDEAAKAEGLERIALRMAERAVSAMTDDF